MVQERQAHCAQDLPLPNDATIAKRYPKCCRTRDCTVAENIDLPLSYKNMPRAERQALVADTLDRFNIVGKKDLFPS